MTEKTFSAETLALLLAALMKKEGKPAIAIDYKTMSSLSDGKFTATALEHQFRGPKARARELYEEANAIQAAGGKLTPVPSPVKSKKRGGMSAQSTSMISAFIKMTD